MITSAVALRLVALIMVAKRVKDTGDRFPLLNETHTHTQMSPSSVPFLLYIAVCVCGVSI